jgi:hypothetical protein
MSEPQQSPLDEKAEAFIAQLTADPSLVAALNDDPRAVLTTAGLPSETIDEIEEAMLGADVEGFVKLKNGKAVKAADMLAALAGVPGVNLNFVHGPLDSHPFDAHPWE